LDVPRLHGAQNRQGPADIGLVEVADLLKRQTDLDQGREVNDPDRRPAIQRALDIGVAADVASLKRPPLDEGFMSVRQIVEGHRRKACFGQTQTGMAADIAGAACHQNMVRHR